MNYEIRPMRTLTWNTSGYQSGGRPAFLVSGEFHYFRVPHADWERRLNLFKEAGGNAVATYIPWLLHEPTEGDIRFGDTPYRDLEAFLTRCRELELLVTARPGPYQYSELQFDGLPGWLCEGYPEILARGVDGKSFRRSSVSYLHPLFLEKARRWYAHVAPLIARHTVSRGGSVGFVQFDNELMGIHEWFGSWDYHPETMGFGTPGGRFPRFLETRYGSVDAMNAAWGSAFADFTAARPLSGKPSSDGERRRVKDYQDFYFGTVAEYAATLVGWLREEGVDCDIVHNSANPYMNSYFLEVVERMRADGVPFVLGSDHYYNLDQDWDQNNPTPQYALKNFCSHEQLRLLGMPPTVFELPGGSCSDWPPVTPEDLRAAYMLNVAFGMKGLNYYIFTGGPNPENTGCFDDIYDFQAPVAADGRLRPTYDAMKRFGRFLKRHAWLAGAELISDFRLGLVWEYSRSKDYGVKVPDLLYSGNEAWTLMRKGFMSSAMCASFTPELASADRGDEPLPTDKPIFLAAASALSAHGQRRLVDFVERGGKLVVAPILPTLDENFQPCTILLDYLGATPPEPHTAQPRFAVGTEGNVLVNGALFVSHPPPGASVFAVEERSGRVGGWRLRKGGGEVFWLGLSWKHAKHSHAGMMAWLLGETGVPAPAVTSDNPCVWAVRRGDGRRSGIFAMNLFSAPMKATLRFRQGMHPGERSLVLKPMEVKFIELPQGAMPKVKEAKLIEMRK